MKRKTRKPTSRQYHAIAARINQSSNDLMHMEAWEPQRLRREITTIVKRIERDAEKLGQLHRGGDAHKQLDWIGGTR